MSDSRPTPVKLGVSASRSVPNWETGKVRLLFPSSSLRFLVEGGVVNAVLLAGVLSVSPYGVNGHLPSGADLDAAAGAGIGWVRYDFNWFQIEGTAGQFDWSAQDAAVAAAVGRGIDVFATLAYT